MINRHKVFISYYHADDQLYKYQLENMRYFDRDKMRFESVFEDCSVRNGDIDYSLSSEQIRKTIRDYYIQDATVLILLCGRNTKRRKHVDWEIHAAMYNSDINPQMGILVINLPSISQHVRASHNGEEELIDPNTTWVKCNTDRLYNESSYPFMPDRIIDNFVLDKPITVVNWSTIQNNPEKLMRFIDNAFVNRNKFKYDHSRPLRRNNS